MRPPAVRYQEMLSPARREALEIAHRSAPAPSAEAIVTLAEACERKQDVRAEGPEFGLLLVTELRLLAAGEMAVQAGRAG